MGFPLIKPTEFPLPSVESGQALPGGTELGSSAYGILHVDVGKDPFVMNPVLLIPYPPYMA